MLQTLNKTQRIKEWESWKKWGKRENSSLWEEDRLWGILPISIRRQSMMLSWTRILTPLTVNMEGDSVLEIPYLKNNSVGKTILEWTSWSLSDLRKKFAAQSVSSTWLLLAKLRFLDAILSIFSIKSAPSSGSTTPRARVWFQVAPCAELILMSQRCRSQTTRESREEKGRQEPRRSWNKRKKKSLMTCLEELSLNQLGLTLSKHHQGLKVLRSS